MSKHNPQSATIAGTPEPTEARALLPLFYAKSVPSPSGMPSASTRYTAAQALDHLACRLLDGVANARAQMDDAENLISHGETCSTIEQIADAHEALDDATEVLNRLLSWYRAMMSGAPKSWFVARRDELESMLQAQRDRDCGYFFADVDMQGLLDALTEI